MKDFAKSIVCNTKAGKSRVVNADVVKDGNTWVVLYAEGTKSKEFDNEAEAKKFAAQVGNSKVGNAKDKTGAEEFFKQLSDDVKEREKKDDADIEKVGNLSKDELLKELDAEEKLLKVLKERGGEKGYGTTPILYRDAERRIQDLKNKLKQIGNKVGNQSPQERLNQDLSIIKEECRKKGISLSFSELAKELEKYGWDFNELRKLKLPVSVGNARYTTREDVISHLDTDLYDICKKVPAGSPSYAYVSELQKKGWDISTISKYSKEIGKIIDQYKVGNSKTGNSAQDDKFAYVMREFDEGKLKTPDGKVVTDPSQAKAIAYSESKKTENGLARARNAIKKS